MRNGTVPSFGEDLLLYCGSFLAASVARRDLHKLELS